MKIKHSVPHSPRQLGRRSAAFSLVEVTIGMGVIGTAVVPTPLTSLAMVCKTTFTKKQLRQAAAGSSLVEALIAIGITGLLMLALASISMLSGRTFVAFSNYVDLDDHNRIGMDTLTR